MSEIIDSSLKKAAKGTSLVLASIAASQLLWFFIKILIVRNTTKVEFGLYSLVLAVLSVISAVIVLGIPSGLSRFVSVYLAEDRRKDADYIARAGAQIIMPLGLICFAALYFFSGFIARSVFYTPELAAPLRMISFLIPFSVAAGLAGGVLRGHGMITQRVLSDVFNPILFLLLLITSILFGMHLRGILYAYVLSGAAVSGLIVVYALAKIGEQPFLPRDGRRHMELLKFSIPLLASGIMSLMLMWADTLMLGRYSTPAAVGTYSVSVSLVKLLLLPLSALGYVFLPIASEIYAKKQTLELKKIYQVLTKWVFAATLPIFFVLVFFPEMTITLLFGNRFVDASLSLRVLAIGFLVHAFLGTNGMLLIALGLTRTIMGISIAGAVLNVVLNYILIKQLGIGITGAAIATMTSYIFINLLYSLNLLRHSRIHPFSASYLKPVAGATGVGLVVYVIAKALPLSLLLLPVYFLLFIGGYVASLLLTKSIETEDLFILEQVLNRMGVRPEVVLRLLKRFGHRIEKPRADV